MKNLFDEYLNMRHDILKSGTAMTETEFKRDLQNKLLNIFAVGDFYYFVFNIELFQFEYIDPAMTKILGYTNENFCVELFFEKLHPDDLSFYLDFEKTVVLFFSKLAPEKILKYKTRFDFRLQKANGTYVRILHQVVPIQCKDDGGIIRTLVVHTDITNLKTSNKSILSFIGLDGEPSYIDVPVNAVFSISKEKISKREKEILMLLAKGKSSKEISEKLFISKFTVDRHRNNMLLKFKTNNISELISKAITEGWI